MDIHTERIAMLQRQAADALKAMWDAEAKGDHELSRWHWDRFVKAMASTRELKESRRYRYGKGKKF
jgi:hypothetical protein